MTGKAHLRGSEGVIVRDRLDQMGDSCSLARLGTKGYARNLGSHAVSGCASTSAQGSRFCEWVTFQGWLALYEGATLRGWLALSGMDVLRSKASVEAFG